MRCEIYQVKRMGLNKKKERKERRRERGKRGEEKERKDRNIEEESNFD